MIELKNVQIWQKSIEAIASFISEGNFRFNSNGVSLKATDQSQIVLVDYTLPKSAFDKFDVEPSLIGLDLVELSKIMNRTLARDRLLMNITDSELMVKLEGELSRSFKLPLIDVSDDEIKMPESKYDTTVEISARILKEALKDASLFGSSVVMLVKGDNFTIEARGSQGTLHTNSKPLAGLKINSKKDVVSKYSLNFLMNIVKVADPEQTIKLEFSSDIPLRVSYNIADAKINYYLAHMLL